VDEVGCTNLRKNGGCGAVQSTFSIDGISVTVNFGQANCKRYKVVEEKIIEACGKLDTSRYLSVEEVSD